MQFHQLETFVRVAECGSFSGAARLLYISSSAVAQQINGLETDIGTELFVRTTHGLSLTEIGKYVFSEGKKLIEKDREIQSAIQVMKYEQDNCIVLGTGMRQNCSLFYSLWGRFIIENDQYQIRTMDITNYASFMHESRKPDLIESINDGEQWQKEYSFLYLCKDRIVCAVPKSHPLAGKEKLTYDMMLPYTLITAPQGMSSNLDQLASEATAAGIHVRHAKVYDFSLFSECALNNWLIQIPEVWGYMCTDFVLIPCEWDYDHDYGFFYKEPKNKPLQAFIRFVMESYHLD